MKNLVKFFNKKYKMGRFDPILHAYLQKSVNIIDSLDNKGE